MHVSFAVGFMDQGSNGVEIVWSRLAKETLALVLDYIQTSFGDVVAKKVYTKINNHVDSLAFFPRIGILDKRYSSEILEVRYIVSTPNIIHYTIVEDVIIIISVFDTRRSVETIETVIRDFLKP